VTRRSAPLRDRSVALCLPAKGDRATRARRSGSNTPAGTAAVPHALRAIRLSPATPGSIINVAAPIPLWKIFITMDEVAADRQLCLSCPFGVERLFAYASAARDHRQKANGCNCCSEYHRSPPLRSYWVGRIGGQACRDASHADTLAAGRFSSEPDGYTRDLSLAIGRLIAPVASAGVLSAAEEARPGARRAPP
jgi:hypothetical protein